MSEWSIKRTKKEDLSIPEKRTKRGRELKFFWGGVV